MGAGRQTVVTRRLPRRDEMEWWPVSRLRERLRTGGFTVQGLRRVLGVRYPDDVGPLNHAPMVERLRPDSSPAGMLMRLFYLETSERASALREVISRPAQAALVRAGLLARRGQAVTARVRIDVLGQRYLLADRRFGQPDPGALDLPPGDMVYPPGSDSAILAESVGAIEGATALDLCTGSGVQGLAVADRMKCVVATDIGPRAVAMARANARLNQVGNFEVRQGNLFHPVSGQRFDLILANPPFVPSPRRGPAYHSGGAYGDRVLRGVINGWDAHLRRGGRAFVISHLALRSGEGVAVRLRPWVRQFGGRVLALLLDVGSPVDLAAAQALFALDSGFTSYAAEVRRWVAYLARHRIARIVLMLLVAERSGRRRLEVVEGYQRTLPLPLAQPPRDYIDRWLAR